MKVELRLKIGKGGAWKNVRCSECGETRRFKSFKAARDHAKSIGHEVYKARRVYRWQSTR